MRDTQKTLTRDLYTINVNHFARYWINELSVSADHNHDHLKLVISGHNPQPSLVNDAINIVQTRIAELQALTADLKMIMESMEGRPQ
jgi:hypothetical protein